MRKYDHKYVEKKWQDDWAKRKPFRADNHSEKEKYYVLIEFPYPSGQGLHVGHPRPYTALDIVARQKRMQGKNVLFPMGWDAFGLPTENYAIKNKIHPRIVTERNVARFKSQLQALGFSFDWDREINTTDPNYYKWTQWIFLKMFEAGLAYKKEMAVNWCPSCKCVLANEEVIDGSCERCGTPVERRVKSQWMLKITEYADKLLADLDDLDFIPRVKTQQRNWIGRSEGAAVRFKTNSEQVIEVFTTRPDTIFGVSYLVVSPEHAFINQWADQIQNKDEVTEYQRQASRKSDLERTELAKEKTGVRLEGVHAIHPLTQKELPIYIADYVLAGYGTGAVMGVPAHDERDFAFATKFDLPIIEVIEGASLAHTLDASMEDATKAAGEDVEILASEQRMVNSDFINGMNPEDAKTCVCQRLEELGIGEKKVQYKLRDWIFSRQRYWGEPIPMVNCPNCGWVPLPESELPLLLPDTDYYEPTDNGESPLAAMKDWVRCTCPRCGGAAERETDTMPQWAGSSWYFMRYCDPHCETAPASKEALDYWLPVDWYNGGMEHTTLHLLYSRFWHKFLHDEGVVSCREPYLKRTSHGMILGTDGEKMSKSRGNVVNPDEIIDEHGADTMRLYEMFIGDFEKAAPWNPRGMQGCRRFLERTWGLWRYLPGLDVDERATEGEVDLKLVEAAEQKLQLDASGYLKTRTTVMHQTIRKVTEDIDHLKMNTAVAALMSLLNRFYEDKSITRAELSTFLRLLNPFAPHLTEELNEELLGLDPITEQAWPSFDPALCVEDEVEVAIQVNGKMRGKMRVSRQLSQEELVEAAKAEEKVAAAIQGKTIRKEIVVPGRLVNLVVG